jgi:hypothetical protein
MAGVGNWIPTHCERTPDSTVLIEESSQVDRLVSARDGAELDMPSGIIQNIAYNILEYHNVCVVESVSINTQQESERYAYLLHAASVLCKVGKSCFTILLPEQRGRIHHCLQPRSPR